jgi:general secretion pathway protein M
MRILSAIPIWRHEALAQRRTASQFAIQATTEQLATLQLQQRLARSVDAAGGLLRTAGAIEGAVPGSVRVHGEADLTMAQLYQLLRHLEGEEPYVVVEYISVGANRAFETGHLAPMDVRVQLSATYHPVQPE